MQELADGTVGIVGKVSSLTTSTEYKEDRTQQVDSTSWSFLQWCLI